MDESLALIYPNSPADLFVMLSVHGYQLLLILGGLYSYKLVMDDGRGGRLRKVYEGGATSYKAVKLQPASSYRIVVQVHTFTCDEVHGVLALLF